MFDESSQPPSPQHALVTLAPLDPEWRPIFQASNQVVLYNPTSHALSIAKQPSKSDLRHHHHHHHRHPIDAPVATTSASPCPYCHRPLPPGFERGDEDSEDDEGLLQREAHRHLTPQAGHSRTQNYFQLLAIANQAGRSDSGGAGGGAGGDGGERGFSREAMADGYFKAFFKEEYRLGMGANGSVYLCQHVLDGNLLGQFAVKKIAVGQSHSYLIGILREIRLLETLRHRNIITYHHAWLETAQFSAFGPRVPTLHVLMQWAEGGSLDDFIDIRLGRSTRLPHLRHGHGGTDADADPADPASAPAAPDPQTPSARIRAFRAMKRAPPEERERLRRAMGGDGWGGGGGGWKAVHLFSAEEVLSLFRDVAEGLAFLHDRSILHLDLKPGNVLLTWDEGQLIPRAMLSDFGTSRDMLASKPARSGNTGTLEYASPESLPDLATGLLREIDSKADMWSLGMILHKILFFRLPYRYATDGEASAADDADKMDRLEREVQAYPGFRSSASMGAAFEARHLPRAFLILLESLLNVNPSLRPSCERVLSAIREGRFNPVAPDATASSAGYLVPVPRSSVSATTSPSANNHSPTHAHAHIPPRRSPPPLGMLTMGSASASSGVSQDSSIRDDDDHERFYDGIEEEEEEEEETRTPTAETEKHPETADMDAAAYRDDMARVMHSTRTPYEASRTTLGRVWHMLPGPASARPRGRAPCVQAVKSVVLAAKAVSLTSLHSHPLVFAIMLSVAVVETLVDSFVISLLLGAAHIAVLWLFH
ncbi:kinase-like protein [Coniophora puteana RWD-64-598 SS2]|uniref:non-specific serine/threonine protein kinase n=1 Tax=Coniophora puteana (strain RWD-64-598) TaxID=741705 RepID=A0A5M3MF82_CONPW|nr:kinase-like protein [Coniophora puteana RWD-64-598 SS2]EIW77275.1 kinase-like protein [Coniophora puteana RWD-64-598 SS2]